MVQYAMLAGFGGELNENLSILGLYPVI
jgi:hypothetical protein